MPPADKNTPRLTTEQYTLIIQQCPVNGRSLNGKEKDRKPIDPPPIIQLQIRDLNDPAQNYLQSPYYLCVCSLVQAKKDEAPEDPTLVGTLVSSLHRLKDKTNHDAGFFVFPDVSVKAEGEFRLKFTLWELLDGQSISLQSVICRPFVVHPPKSFPGLAESTFLTRLFSDQGVRLRIRKETRTSIKRSVSEAENGPYHVARDVTGMPVPEYVQGGHYHPGYAADYAHGLVKRQKSGGGQGYGDREGWAYSQSQGSPGMYAHPSGQPGSGYYQDPVSGGPQLDFAFRPSGNGEGAMAPSPYYQRPMPEYTHASPSMPYGGQPRPDGSNGMNYPDATAYSTIASPDSSAKRSDYSGQGVDQGIRTPYRYSAQGSAAGPNTLPPITSAASQSTDASATSSPSYTHYAHGDARYAPPGIQGPPRTQYAQYPGQAYQITANYT